MNIAVMFFGICLTIAGLYDDLMDTIHKIDSPPDGKYNRIVSCIKYHDSILGYNIWHNMVPSLNNKLLTGL